MQLKERKEDLVGPIVQKVSRTGESRIEQKSQASTDAYFEKLQIYFFWAPRKAYITNCANYANHLSQFLRLVGPLAKGAKNCI